MWAARKSPGDQGADEPLCDGRRKVGMRQRACWFDLHRARLPGSPAARHSMSPSCFHYFKRAWAHMMINPTSRAAIRHTAT
jgi:hypothetical protein